MSDRHKKAVSVYAVLLGAVWIFAAGSWGLDWPQYQGPQRDNVLREEGLLEKFPDAGLKLLWSTPIATGYSGPAVADGRVYLMDRLSTEGLPTQERPNSGRRHERDGLERVLCLDADSGEMIWEHRYSSYYKISYPSGPRVAPTVDGDRVYTISAMGDIRCLDAAKGDLVWSKDLPKEFGCKAPIWGFGGCLLVDGDLLISLGGGDGRAVMAFNKHTGEEVWRALSSMEGGYCGPMIHEIGGKRQMLVWNPTALSGLDPQTGDVFWSVPFEVGLGMSITPPAQQGNRLVVSGQFCGAMLAEVADDSSSAKVIWKHSDGGRGRRGPDSLGFNTVMSTVFYRGDYIYGISTFGTLVCIDANTARAQWETMEFTNPEPSQRLKWCSAWMYPRGDRDWLFNEHGELIIMELSPEGFQEISRTKIIEPDMPADGRGHRMVVWSPPAFAKRKIYVRNDSEIRCLSIDAENY